MEWEFSKKSTPIARKTYECDACAWLDNMGYENFADLSFSDKKLLVKLRKNKLIMPGEKYLKVTGKFEGEFAVFRAKLTADYLCEKMGFWE
jgi:hypothetical protein